MTLYWITLATALALTEPAWAQEPAQPAATETEADKKVEVSGVKNPAQQPYRIMTRGLDPFDQQHALAARNGMTRA